MFKQLKCRLTVKSFTGKSVLSVEQDFHARVLLMNLTNLFVLEADRRIERRSVHREHRYQANPRPRSCADGCRACCSAVQHAR